MKIEVAWIDLLTHSHVIAEVVTAELLSIDFVCGNETVSIEPVERLTSFNARAQCLLIHPLFGHGVPLVVLAEEA